MISFGQGIVLATIDSIVDPEILRGWRNDYRVFKYCRQMDLIPSDAQKRWFDKQSMGDENNRMYCIATKKEDKQLTRPVVVGVCGLTSINWVNRNAEFSLYIAPEYQRKGYAKAALKTLFSHGFLNLNLHSIWGESFEYNGARGLFKWLGMSEDGIRKHFYYREGKYIDAYLYTMTKEEWDTNGKWDQSGEHNSARKQICST